MKRFFCSWRETYKDLSIRRCRFPARARCGSMVLIKSAGLWGYCLERLTVAGERTGFAANTRRDPTHLTLTRHPLVGPRSRRGGAHRAHLELRFAREDAPIAAHRRRFSERTGPRVRTGRDGIFGKDDRAQCYARGD
jgi:hypothetical protein